jgi:two-component system chemotaxis response regulator CheY
MPRVILIVEDSETCAETLQIALEAMGDVEARPVRGVQAALAVLNDAATDVAAVVTDFHMPRRNGLELIGQLRADQRYARLPILLISGDSDPRLPERALAEGANAFFAKPYSPAAVRRKLEQMLC